MPRLNLLALTIDDLVVLSNRGLVKRASKELASNELSYELIEDDTGTVTIQWSDQIKCVLPGNSTVKDSHCSCAATTICRHLIRSVLVYQQTLNIQDNQQTPDTSKSSESYLPSSKTEDIERSSQDNIKSQTPWNPGNITDEELAKYYNKTTLKRIKQTFESGQIIELIRTEKPIAYFHTLSFTLRFLVPGDIRYTHCDCAESAPCSHVPLAVWAFRLLAEGQLSGVVSTHKSPLHIPILLLDDIEQSLQELVESGIANVSQALIRRFHRLQTKCKEENLIWLTEIITELLQEKDYHTSHNARFSPTHVVKLVGEVCIRCDAIRNDTGAVPQLFIRGSSADKLTKMGAARLVGLGCGVQIYHHNITINSYLQDIASGVIVAVCREFTHPPEDATESPSKPFWQLAQTAVMKGVSLASLGGSQLLIKGGKRSPNYRFVPGRAKVTANPQTFNWESLRAPVLAESFGEIYTRLINLPPSSLRPRRLTENFYVCAISTVEAVEFSVSEQVVTAILRDCKGDRAILIHPYTYQGRDGTERLLSTLQELPSDCWRFVAGQVSLANKGLVINPISLVFQQGKTRTILQPWVDRWQENEETVKTLQSKILPLVSQERQSQISTDPIVSYSMQLTDAIAELVLTGLQRTSETTTQHWQEIYQSGASLGFVRLLDPIAKLVEMLEQKNNTLHWDTGLAAKLAIKVAILVRLMQEECSASL
jgi:hypothetical protein